MQISIRTESDVANADTRADGRLTRQFSSLIKTILAGVDCATLLDEGAMTSGWRQVEKKHETGQLREFYANRSASSRLQPDPRVVWSGRIAKSAEVQNNVLGACHLNMPRYDNSGDKANQLSHLGP